MVTGALLPEPLHPPDQVTGLRWRREFPGDERQLRVLRQWLASLLPPCPARDDVVIVANELSGNAISHTRSGHGGRFAVEVTWSGVVVRVAVADGGAETGPVEVDDPAGEHGRGLVVVRELSVRRGACGGRLGRLVWADVAWDSMPAAAAAAPPAGQEAAIGDDEAVLARLFAGVLAWFGRSTLAWRALAGRAGGTAWPGSRAGLAAPGRSRGDGRIWPQRPHRTAQDLRPARGSGPACFTGEEKSPC
jgi:anti-sigma regulatory factor (Ser/Thr protein kinase)